MNPEVESIKEQMKTEYDNEHWEKTIEYCDEGIKLDDSDWTWYLFKSGAYYKMREIDESTMNIHKAGYTAPDLTPRPRRFDTQTAEI